MTVSLNPSVDGSISYWELNGRDGLTRLHIQDDICMKERSEYLGDRAVGVGPRC